MGKEPEKQDPGNVVHVNFSRPALSHSSPFHGFPPAWLLRVLAFLLILGLSLLVL